MPIKKAYCILLLVISNLSLAAQKKLLNEIEKFSSKIIHPDSVVAKIQKESDLVVGYATYSEAWSIPPFYRIIAKQNNKWIAYEYKIKPYAKVFTDSNGKQTTEPFFEIIKFDIDGTFIDSFLSIFKEQKLWQLKCDKTKDYLFIHCTHLLSSKYDPCSIKDGMSVGSLIMTKQYVNSSSFYAPEYYEYKCCPGNPDRRRFLATIAPIKELFKKLSQQVNRP